MSKRSRIEQVKKKKHIETPKSINIVETAKLSKDNFRLLDSSEYGYIAEYIFELHDTVCPKYEELFYEEIRKELFYSNIDDVRSNSVVNIHRLLKFVEKKCMNYRFVGSILSIVYYLMDDLTDSERRELLDFDKDKEMLGDFFDSKRPDKSNSESHFISHSNTILVDRELKQAERFEPHGSISIMESENLDKLLQEGFAKIGYKYFSPKSFCPSQTVQGIHGLSENPLYRDMGYCTVWSFWYMDNRVLNPQLTRDETITMIMDMFRNKDEKFMHETIHFYWTNLIRYIELRTDNISSKRALEIMYHESIPKLGEEKLINRRRAITTYEK